MGIILGLIGGAVLVAPYAVGSFVFWRYWFFGYGRRWPTWTIGLTGVVATFLLVWIGMVGFGLLAWSCYGVAVVGGVKPPIDRLSVSVVAAVVGFPTVYAGAYYWYRSRFLRIMNVMSPRCSRCDYALRGLPVRYGRVKCPECAHTNDVRDVVKRFQHDKRLLKGARKRPWEM